MKAQQNNSDVATDSARELAWQRMYETERQMRRNLDLLEPCDAQEEASWFPEALDITTLLRRNSAYPERIILQFNHEFALAAR